MKKYTLQRLNNIYPHHDKGLMYVYTHIIIYLENLEALETVEDMYELFAEFSDIQVYYSHIKVVYTALDNSDRYVIFNLVNGEITALFNNKTKNYSITHYDQVCHMIELKSLCHLILNSPPTKTIID